MRVFAFIQSILALAIGLGIYLYGRPHTTLLTEGLSHTYRVSMPTWVKYNLPDGLWLWSLLQTLSLVWGKILFTKGFVWLIACIAGALLSEIAQYFKLIRGTYDIGDIIAYTLAASLFILQQHIILNHKTK